MNPELAFVGSVLLSQGSFLDDVRVQPSDFLSHGLAAIYTKALELHNRGVGVDIVTLSAELPKFAVLMHEAISFTPTAANWEFYAEAVTEVSLRQKLRNAAANIQQMADKVEQPIMVDEVRKTVDDALGARVQRVSFMAQEINETISHLGDKPDLRLSPWSRLNSVIGGFRPGALYIIAARPGVGKTVIGLNIALELAQKGAVAFSSLEMSTGELHKRVIAQMADVHMAELTGTETLAKVSADRIAKMQAKLTLPLAIDDRAGVNIHDIRTFARSVHREMPLRAIVVDYVGLISAPGNSNASRYEVVTQISQQLKVMARDLQVPVIALAQLNREVENRKDSKPMLSDLRDSGSLEQDADVVILLRRDSATNRNVITLDVAKNRHGETQTLDLGFQGEYSRATNHQIK